MSGQWHSDIPALQHRQTLFIGAWTLITARPNASEYLKQTEHSRVCGGSDCGRRIEDCATKLLAPAMRGQDTRYRGYKDIRMLSVVQEKEARNKSRTQQKQKAKEQEKVHWLLRLIGGSHAIG
jgi:hypothetical protein